MTEKTVKLLSELTEALYDKKALLLTGTTGVGKTFLAKKIAENLKKKEYSSFPTSEEQSVVVEIISCHNNVTYEDVIGGISVNTDSEEISFEYKDKILLETLLAASKAFELERGTKYVLILDDIQRNDVSSLLGDAIEVIGTEGEKRILHLNSGMSVEVPPNFYIVGTYNATETGSIVLSNELLAKFYVREILSDVGYITEDRDSENAIFYDQIRSLIVNYLDMQYKLSTYEQKRYLLGHGYFVGKDVALKIKYQLIPLLKQYLTEGILDSTAEESIRLLEVACDTGKREVPRKQEENCFSEYRQGVTPERFNKEDTTSVPLENLIGRIIDQRLLTNDDIKKNLLFNACVCYREKEVSGITYQAQLLAGNQQYEKIRRGGSDGRRLYNGGTIIIDEIEYHFTGGMQPGEYTQKPLWEVITPYSIGESTSPNVILFGIIRFYYKTLLDSTQQYLVYNPEDTSKRQLYKFIHSEWTGFLEKYKSLKPERATYTVDEQIEIDNAKEAQKKKRNKLNLNEKEKALIARANVAEKARAAREAQSNKEANDAVRRIISELKVLWSNVGDVLGTLDGMEIILEGVNSAMSDSIYQEYRDAMEMLGIKQMILQGPPGTSKTYSAKAFLKYMADNCSDEELADIQIADYSQPDKYCAKLFKGKATPKIAWDIVQFHPSYGYEDFIRGIKVSTKPGSDTIMYETVNKVLGSIAELAKQNTKTKFFLIIDEINRANLATVFGELIYGLEYRTEPVATPYAVNNNNRISLPDNLYIIGTMNTADKSIGGIDYAIRRRFLFFEQLPDEKVIKGYKADNGTAQIELNDKACKLFAQVERVFEKDYLSPEYRREDVQIGHTYFLVDSEEKLMRRFEYQIIPILKEYYKDGIISFSIGNSLDGFSGFLNCIAGKINMTTQKKEIEKIFKELIA